MADSESHTRQYADWSSKQQFPAAEDAHYSDMAKREILAKHGLSEPLTVMERAELAAKREFPQASDEYYRWLAFRNNLYLFGRGPQPSPKHLADLYAKCEFEQACDKIYRRLARKELLGSLGIGPGLDSLEATVLEKERACRAQALKIPAADDVSKTA